MGSERTTASIQHEYIVQINTMHDLSGGWREVERFDESMHRIPFTVLAPAVEHYDWCRDNNPRYAHCYRLVERTVTTTEVVHAP